MKASHPRPLPPVHQGRRQEEWMDHSTTERSKRMADLWQHEEPVSSYRHEDHDTIHVPPWIDQSISPSDVAAIIQGGCTSGAYMPAVTYHEALKTMGEHGDAIFQFIEDHHGEIPHPVSGHNTSSWAAMACFYVSVAVETWADSVSEPLSDLLDALEEEPEAATA